MSLKQIEIAGYRGFASPQTIPLAMPNGKAGSGITMLIGPNNAGKSTVIEAFIALSNSTSPSFSEGKRNRKANERVSIAMLHETEGYFELRTVDGSETEWSGDGAPGAPVRENIFVLPSRRFFSPYFHRRESNRGQYIGEHVLPNQRNEALNQFNGRLFHIQKNREIRKKFDDVLSQVLDPVPEWYIEQADNGQFYLKFRAGDDHHNSDGLGDGIVSLLFIIDALYDSQQGAVIIIDEPELSLHPALQRKLFRLFSNYAKDRQIVYATHSPYFVDFEAIVNGAKVNRIHQQDGDCVVSTLSQDSAEQLRGLLNDVNNPHIFGLDAREAFFQEDRIVLVEGQEDVIFFKIILKALDIELKGEFLGWGVGGASKMRVVAGMLKELRFQKVVGILDRNGSNTCHKLSQEFPDYNFHTIPTDDVRDKPERKARSAVAGLVDGKRVLKEQYREELVSMFDQVNCELQGLVQP